MRSLVLIMCVAGCGSPAAVSLLDVSADGSRRILIPGPYNRARLVASDSTETIVEVGDAGDRRFSSDGTWLATTSSSNENWARDLVIRRSRDGEVLARVALSPGSSVSDRILNVTVLPNDLILTRNQLGVRALRFLDGNLSELGRHDVEDVESWATQESEMLIAVAEDGQTRVQRLALPSLEPTGELVSKVREIPCSGTSRMVGASASWSTDTWSSRNCRLTNAEVAFSTAAK